MARYNIAIDAEDGVDFVMNLTQEEAATIKKLVDEYHKRTKGMKYVAFIRFTPMEVEKAVRTYPCDNGGECPYDALYGPDCRYNCGLGVDDNVEEEEEE